MMILPRLKEIKMVTMIQATAVEFLAVEKRIKIMMMIRAVVGKKMIRKVMIQVVVEKRITKMRMTQVVTIKIKMMMTPAPKAPAVPMTTMTKKIAIMKVPILKKNKKTLSKSKIKMNRYPYLYHQLANLEIL